MSVFISVFVFMLVGAYAHGLQVNTTEGVVEGYRAADGEYYVFYGVPYGGPTEGTNRFKAPLPPAPYPGLLHAIDSNVMCAQPSPRGLIGAENCLKVSIATNNVTTPKPVIVFLNSEEYTTTKTEQLSFKRFVEQDVVFIALNFRLSIFGFLCLGVDEAPGNAGLKDVILGLRWINTNIANFGGDPNNVVLMGHGSGAAIVDLITLSPQSRGLVHKAVALSGSGLAPWAVAYDPVGYAFLVGAKLGYTRRSNRELAQRLVTTDFNTLHTALSEFNFRNNTPMFAPCIENPNLNPNDTVLGDAPLNILRSGNYLQIPYIGGYTTREGTKRAGNAAFGNWLEAMQANFSDFIQVDINIENNRTAVVSAIRDFYFSSSPISMSTIEDYLDYHGDTMTAVSVIRAARERGMISSSEVRLLEFGYIGTTAEWIYNQIPLNGARHGSFLNFLFDFDLSPSDDPVMRSIVRRFTSFAYTGVPNPANEHTSAIWPAITRQQLNYLYYGGSGNSILNQTSILIEEPRFNPHNITMNFWNDILARYYVPPKPTSSSEKIISSITAFMLSLLFIYVF